MGKEFKHQGIINITTRTQDKKKKREEKKIKISISGLPIDIANRFLTTSIKPDFFNEFIRHYDPGFNSVSDR